VPELVRNGWNIYFHSLFRDRYDALRASVTTLEQRAAAGEITAEALVEHPDVKLFSALHEIINVKVPQDPQSKSYEQGNTLGKVGKGWRRVKGQGLPGRLRLFFRFDTSEKAIVFAWLNDENTQRKTGAKTDCYEVFGAMLKRKNPPSTFQELLVEVRKQETDAAALAAAQDLGQAQNQA
jgi:toxin YhaV